jgi:hypothetical protein
MEENVVWSIKQRCILIAHINIIHISDKMKTNKGNLHQTSSKFPHKEITTNRYARRGKIVCCKIYLMVKPSHLSAMQTVSLSVSPTPLTSSWSNLLEQ